MAFQYIEAPNHEEIKNPHSIFLAGGITGCQDWQKSITDKLQSFDDLTICNPRRANFEIFKSDANWIDSEIQIKWEYEYLRKVNQMLFWFSYETVQPIVLFELGAALERTKIDNGQWLMIGTHPEYVRNFDLKIQCKLQSYTDIFYGNLEEFSELVYKFNKNLRFIKEREKNE